MRWAQADHLVAVSTYDPETGPTSGLPRVGDYLNFDWELLGTLRPHTMIIQKDPSLLPLAVQSHANALGMRLVKLTIVRLDDVFTMINQELGPAVNDAPKAEALATRLHVQLDAIEARTRLLPKVRTLVIVNAGGQDVAGQDNFVDDELRIAGGLNVATDLGESWPTVDREKLVALQPDAIVQLMPDASPQVRRRAQEFWNSLPDVPAVKNRRVLLMSDSWCLLPGAHVGDVTARIANFLHPPAGEP